MPKETGRILIVGDRILLDAHIIVEYHQHEVDYLGPLKLTKDMRKAILEIPEENFLHIPLLNGDGLYCGAFIPWTFTSKRVKEVKSGRNIYETKSVLSRALVVKSLQKENVDRNTREKKIAKFEAVLKDLQSKLNRKHYKTVEAVEKRLKDLQTAYKCPYIKIEISLTEDEKVKLIYHRDEEALRVQEKLDGKYIMVTNCDTFTAADMIQVYKARDKSEKTFADVKGPLQVRPIYLHKDERIEGLTFFIMCALLVYSILRGLIKEAKLPYSIKDAMRIFEGLTVSYIEFADGSSCIKCSDLNYKQFHILDELGIPLPREYIDIMVKQ